MPVLGITLRVQCVYIKERERNSALLEETNESLTSAAHYEGNSVSVVFLITCIPMLLLLFIIYLTRQGCAVLVPASHLLRVTAPILLPHAPLLPSALRPCCPTPTLHLPPCFTVWPPPPKQLPEQAHRSAASESAARKTSPGVSVHLLLARALSGCMPLGPEPPWGQVSGNLAARGTGVETEAQKADHAQGSNTQTTCGYRENPGQN